MSRCTDPEALAVTMKTRIALLLPGLFVAACHTSVDALWDTAAADMSIPAVDAGAEQVPDAGSSDAGFDDASTPSDFCEPLPEQPATPIAAGRADPLQFGLPTFPALLTADRAQIGVLEFVPRPQITTPQQLIGPRVLGLPLEPQQHPSFLEAVTSTATPIGLQALERGCNYALFSHSVQRDALDIELVGAFCGDVPSVLLVAGERPVSPTIRDDTLYYGSVDESAGRFTIHERSPSSEASKDITTAPFSAPKLIIVGHPSLGLDPPILTPVAAFRPGSQPNILALAIPDITGHKLNTYEICGDDYDIKAGRGNVVVTTRCQDEVRVYTFAIDLTLNACASCARTETLLGRSPAALPAPRAALDQSGNIAVTFWEENAPTPSVRILRSDGTPRSQGALRLPDRFERTPGMTEFPIDLDIVGYQRQWGVMFNYAGAASAQPSGTLVRFKTCPL